MQTIDLTTDSTPATAKRVLAADLPMEKDALACRACRACTLVTSDAARNQCELCGCELPELSKRRRIESFFKLRTQSPPPPPSPAASPTPTLTPTPTPAPAPAPATPTPMPTPAPAETAGWHVHLSGRLQPYPPREQLVLEHAWHRGLPKASVTVDGMRSFDVLFEATGSVATGPHAPVAVQRGRAQQRNVHRVPPSRARPEPPLLAAARRVARITRADEVSEPWELLALAAAELEEARRRVAARRGAWVEEAKRLRALDGLKVAVVGASLLGSRGVLHDVVVGAGGAIPTHTQPAEKKVNSQTDLLLVGTLVGAGAGAGAGAGVVVAAAAGAKALGLGLGSRLR